MRASRRRRTVSVILSIVVPAFSVAIISWVIFWLVPLSENVFYEFPVVQLGVAVLAPLLSVGLAADDHQIGRGAGAVVRPDRALGGVAAAVVGHPGTAGTDVRGQRQASADAWIGSVAREAIRLVDPQLK